MNESLGECQAKFANTYLSNPNVCCDHLISDILKHNKGPKMSVGSANNTTLMKEKEFVKV